MIHFGIKRILLFLIAIVCFEFSSNAQNLQKNSYNDGKILAYIESSTSITSFNQRRKNDRLIIENISNSEVTVHYTYHSIRNDHNDNFAIDATKQMKATIQPGKTHVETGYLSNGKTGYYFVDSFSIMNVSGGGFTSNSNFATPSNNNMPSWLTGIWYSDYGDLFKVKDNQIHWHDGGLGDFVRMDGETAFFQWRHSPRAVIKIILLGPGRALYDNPTTGSAYIVMRK